MAMTNPAPAVDLEVAGERRFSDRPIWMEKPNPIVQAAKIIFLALVGLVMIFPLIYVIAVSLKSRVFQEILTAYATPDTTAGIVDANGDFVARSVDYTGRVGTPATQYVRDAVRNANGGLYSGTTYEGLKNYTAYYVSPFSGWSTHLAVASGSIDTPTRLSFVAAGIAALGGLVLGGFLVVLVLRDIAEGKANG